MAFAYCESLGSIDIPRSVTYVGGGVMLNTLWEEDQPSGLTYYGNFLIGYKFEYDENEEVLNDPTSLVVKEGVKFIPELFFTGMSNLNSVELPDTLETIGSEAFAYTGLTSVVIPEGVKKIGAFAFSNCESLVNITVPESVTEIGEYAIGYSYNDETDSYVKCNTVIRGKAGSAAQEYAQKYGLTFTVINDSEVKVGDLDKNGTITLLDVRMMIMYIADGTLLQGEELTAADADGDGSMTLSDVRCLVALIAGGQIS